MRAVLSYGKVFFDATDPLLGSLSLAVELAVAIGISGRETVLADIGCEEYSQNADPQARYIFNWTGISAGAALWMFSMAAYKFRHSLDRCLNPKETNYLNHVLIKLASIGSTFGTIALLTNYVTQKLIKTKNCDAVISANIILPTLFALGHWFVYRRDIQPIPHTTVEESAQPLLSTPILNNALVIKARLLLRIFAKYTGSMLLFAWLTEVLRDPNSKEPKLTYWINILYVSMGLTIGCVSAAVKHRYPAVVYRSDQLMRVLKVMSMAYLMIETIIVTANPAFYLEFTLGIYPAVLGCALLGFSAANRIVSPIKNMAA